MLILEKKEYVHHLFFFYKHNTSILFKFFSIIMTVLTDVGPSSPILLRDMKHSVIERNHSRKLTVEVYIEDVLPETFEADFDISSFKIKFQTR